MKNLLFVSSECVPFIKTGGLADVVGSLPKCFDKQYYDCRVFLPKYMCMDGKWKDQLEYVTHFYMDYDGQSRYVGVQKMVYEGVSFYFLDNEYYFSGDKPYLEHHWDIERFIFFDKAVLSALPLLDFRPDVIHCHDWQTGLIPVFLHDSFQGGEFFRGIKTVMTIHNLKFQGNDNANRIKWLSGLSDYYFSIDKLRTGVDGNMLKGGLVYADAITTVSNTYAEEIKTAFYGEGLDGLMRARKNDLRGIVNGIDTKEWNPKTDKLLAKNYDVRSYVSGKKANKLALQKELGLKETNDVCMIGIVSRLTNQKGIYLITDRLQEIMGMDIQFVVLGTGEANAENAFKWMESEYKGKGVYYCGYNEELAHRIYAGCDLFLMPSLYEPCGIGQLIAMHYGTLPLVRETGGLKDTVHPYNQYTGEGNGFSFWAANADDMVYTLRWAVEQYYDNKPGWKGLIKSAMNTDVSWEQSAGIYEQLYYQLCNWPDE